MHLQQIHIENFKCFSDVTINFEPTGLILVTGENKENPELGSNGIGKSTIFDAVCWCFFEHTAQGLKSGKLNQRLSCDVCNAAGTLTTGKTYKTTGHNCVKHGGTTPKGYSVTVCLSEGGAITKCPSCDEDAYCSTCNTCAMCTVPCSCNDLVIKRTWQPIALTVNGDTRTNDELIKIIGVTEDQFLLANYFAQNSGHFVDMTPGGRIDFLSEVFSLDSWTEVDQKTAKADVELFKTEYLTCTNTLNSFTARREENHANIARLTTKSIEYKNRQEHLKAQAQAQIDTTEIQIKELGNSDVIAQKEQATKIEAFIATLETQMKSLDKTHQDQSVSSKVASRSLIKLREELASLGTRLKEKCVTCKQEITEVHFKSVMAEITPQIAALETELASLELLMPTTSTALVKLQEAYRAAQNKKALLQNDVLRHTLALQTQVNRKKELLAEFTKITAAINLYDDEIAVAQKTSEDHDISIALWLKSQTIAANKLARVEQWVKFFPQIRLMILESMLAELEIHFNQALSTLGLVDWSVMLSPEREKADGKMKRELTITLTNDNTHEEIDIATLSGGERQRLRIASAIGLSDLITHNTNTAVKEFEFYDEPCVGLSKEGATSVISALTALAKTKLVLFSDHRMLDADNINKVILITKDTNGVSNIHVERQFPSSRITDAAGQTANCL